MTTPTLPLSARRRIPVPDRARLTGEQRHGTACVWCAVVLSPETAADLGHRPYTTPSVDYVLTWWPRGCRACVAARAPLPVDTATMRAMARRALDDDLPAAVAASLAVMYRGMLRELVPAVRDAVDDLPYEHADRRSAEADVHRALGDLDHRPRGPGAEAAHALSLAHALLLLTDHLDHPAPGRPPAAPGTPT
ncbi:DUF6415 family natural product biosynthesis protein [Streptomyces fradiae]|uniref:DUF6415 family natural product biosynthesis protein n=1 Tax=Streptomyces fradiae TaxID=1906 RepID=UPI003658EDEE